VVRTAGFVKGDAAMEVISRFRRDTRGVVAFEVCNAWGSFDSRAYAEEVLSGNEWTQSYLYVQTPEQLQAVRYVPGARRVHVSGDHPDLTPLLPLQALDWLYLADNRKVSDLTPLASLPAFSKFSLSHCENVRELAPLARPGLTELSLYSLDHEISLDALSGMPDLRSVLLAYPVFMESVGELPIGPQLTELHLFLETRYLTLDGVERWPRITEMTLASETQIRELARFPSLDGLTVLSLQKQDPLELDRILHLADLRLLYLWQCELPQGLAPLRELPALRNLMLSSCAQSGTPIDLSPLAGLEDLTIRLLGGDTPVVGEDRFAPGRIIRDS
jgi:hypothetical protein